MSSIATGAVPGSGAVESHPCVPDKSRSRNDYDKNKMRVKVTPVRNKHAHIRRFSEGKKIKLAYSSSSSSPETSATIKKAKKIYLLPRMKPIEKEKSTRKSAIPQRIDVIDESGYEADTESDEQESGFWRDYLFAMAMLRVHFNV